MRGNNLPISKSVSTLVGVPIKSVLILKMSSKHNDDGLEGQRGNIQSDDIEVILIFVLEFIHKVLVGFVSNHFVNAPFL